ncbi:type I restriction endonuclease subunit R [Portibacter marinus]|uniref:type I restriction endonuclease subunit R n=1 Tax=Portibacter marinus TaxID=2898660 RepID=UPI001F3FA41F|nr:HsdR family type I site-specific deoxyribonuclease [Portibacter marinus]
MAFNELNSVEHFVIHQLSGVNLNDVKNGQVAENPVHYGANKWRYVPAEVLGRDITEVLLEKELKTSLIRLNPSIEKNPDFADEVIRKLRAILITVSNVGLVRANEEFAKWLRNEHSLPFGKRGEHVKIKLIDYNQLEKNSYIITNQFKIRARETKIPDVVLFLNGIPVVVGEVKTPVRPAVSWYDGAHDIHVTYENSVPQLFVPNILSFSSEGKELYIGAVRTPLEFWSPWRIENEKDELHQIAGLDDVAQQLTHLLKPSTLLDILQFYSVYGTSSSKKKIKVICRYQQYEGANGIVNRVLEGKIKKGLIWHFQGSGKSLLMLFAAQKLRRQAALGNPTVLIVVDRTDLDSQITSSFASADVSNFVTTDSIKELNRLLEKDTRKIIITMIHKFRDSTPDMNSRDNIIVMVDEAHRTQEGNLGRQMRAALPNAFLFGLTGTPINKADKNTFWAFGAIEDEGGYMSRYTFQDSIRDKATLPLHFEPRLPNYHIDKSALDTAFKEMANDLSEEDRNKLSQKAAKMSVFLKAPERVSTIVSDIVSHFKKHVEPEGFKAMIVTPDRYACVQYKEELDKLMPVESSKVVMSSSASDDYEFKQKWGVDKDKQEKIVEEFNTPDSSLQFIIVTAKLLTGFDAPILQTMYLDKSLKDHTLLQAICRTNRLFPNKTFGRIVDYFGVFDDTAQALAFDEATMKTVITNLQELRDKLPEYMTKCLNHFEGVDKTIEGFEGLQSAQNAIGDNEKRDAFAKDYTLLAKLWEALSPDDVLNQYQKDYKWLSQVYTSVKPTSDDNGRLLWHALGAQTTKLIHEYIHVEGINTEMEEMVLDAEIIEELMNKKNPKEAERVVKLLIARFKNHTNNPKFKALGQRLEELRNRAEQGLISSVEFIKHLCELAKDTLRTEKEIITIQEQKTAKSALTELFLEMKNDQTPAIVERIVNDIDDIVKIVRFDGWQTSVTGERLVQKELRKALLKYKLHKEEDLFYRAYEYIKEYY